MNPINPANLGANYGNIKNDLEAEAQLQQQIQKLEAMVKQKLTREALSRFGNVKAAHPELALNLVILLANLIQQGRIKEQISDQQLKEMIRQLSSSQRKDFNIIRK